MPGFFLQTGINPTTVAKAADTLMQAAGSAMPSEPVTSAPAQESFSLFSMIMLGGVMMIPLAILLLLSIYITIERILVISRASKRNNAFLPSLSSLVKKGDLEASKALCRNENSPIGNMIEKGVTRIGQPTAEIREIMTESAQVDIGRLEKNLGILNITGRIAPMFGFIGTIIGVIKIFYDIALAKTVEIEVISTGLYQKMISSAGGLVVGVLAFVAYHWLNARIDRLAHRMEEDKLSFMDILNEPAQ
jgi:biopolymer transport protein ExbB